MSALNPSAVETRPCCRRRRNSGRGRATAPASCQPRYLASSACSRASAGGPVRAASARGPRRACGSPRPSRASERSQCARPADRRSRHRRRVEAEPDPLAAEPGPLAVSSMLARPALERDFIPRSRLTNLATELAGQQQLAVVRNKAALRSAANPETAPSSSTTRIWPTPGRVRSAAKRAWLDIRQRGSPAVCVAYSS